jgi:hypothetical protein
VSERDLLHVLGVRRQGRANGRIHDAAQRQRPDLLQGIGRSTKGLRLRGLSLEAECRPRTDWEVELHRVAQRPGHDLVFEISALTEGAQEILGAEIAEVLATRAGRGVD